MPARRLLAEERGAALVLALSILMTMTIAMTTVISVTMANARDASRTNAGQIAYSLAEAGLNNAFGVINANYSGSTTAYPGDSTMLSSRTTTYSSGTVTWSGTLNPLTGGSWAWEWDITSIGSARNTAVAGGATNVTRTLTATVPVVLPLSQQNGPQNPLNWIYSGTDTVFSQAVTVKSPVYTVGNLTLQSSAQIPGSAGKVAVGGNLTLSTNQNQIGLTGGSDPRIAEAHVVGFCSVKGNVVLHYCGGSSSATNWDSDSVYATTTSRSLTGVLDHTPQLRCCAPYGGVILPVGTATSSEMGFWYKNADLGPLSGCTSGSVPFSFDTGDNTINGSSNLLSAINLTPSTGSYSCTSKNGTLIWDASTKRLTIKGTIFIDGSATIDSSGYSGNPVFQYSGSGTLVVSGTFAMKGAKLCAVVSGTDCNWTPSAWDPSSNALVVVADGDGAGGVAQSQSGIVGVGYGIELVTGTSFQGALIANKSIKTEQNAVEEGPMISVYNQVQSGQTGTLSFPALNFAPAAASSITSGQVPTGLPLVPRSIGG
jgi:Tfp pilus assembly protein PilX